MPPPSRCARAEAAGLIVIVLLMFVLLLLRYGDKIAWSAR
jgi:hypothetical protein